MKLFAVVLFLVFEMAGSSLAACIQGTAAGSSLPLRSEPSTAGKRVGAVPANSCRIAVDMGGCKDGWCRAAFERKFGWLPESNIKSDRTGDRRDANYFVLKAVYEVVGKRSGRGYDLGKAYSQDLTYGPSSTAIKRFYYEHDHFIYPGGAGPTQCVAAVAEVLVETINQILIDTSNPALFAKLPPSHFSAEAKFNQLRPHIWEYDEVHSKGAAHALERFNIGKQIKFSELTPGDFFKMNREKGRGHSTIFINYIDKAGKVLERYSSDVKGLRYFSAQEDGGVDLAGRPTNGLGFRQEYLLGNCPDAQTRAQKHCNINPEGSSDGPNMGFLLYPTAWGDIGTNLRKELANKAYAARLGVAPTEDYTSFIASSGDDTRQGINADVEAELARPIDYKQELHFDK
jgi:hypothetical protein